MAAPSRSIRFGYRAAAGPVHHRRGNRPTAGRGAQVNAEYKLLLGHCFEDCGYGRVKIQTDARNIGS
jgi:hypothetical protein